MKKVEHWLISPKLCEKDWKNMCGRYHFADADLPLLKRAYEEVLGQSTASVYCLTEEEGEGDTAVLVTLGQEVDCRQELLMADGKMWEAYALDCTALELLNKVYEETDRLLHEKTGMWCGSYRFPGSDMPLAENKEIVRAMEQDEVVCNGAYVLVPKKSVTYLTRMQAHRTEKKRSAQLCAGCGRTDCPVRAGDGEETEWKED